MTAEHPQRHRCPTCDHFRALRDAKAALATLEAAADAWLDQCADHEGGEYFYRDVLWEIREILAQPTTSAVMIDGIKAAMRYVPVKPADKEG